MKNFYRDKGLVLTISILVLMLFFLVGYVYTSSTKLFWFIIPFIVLISGFAIGKLITVTRKNFQYLTLMSEKIENANNISIESLPISVAIIDNTKKIIWFNNIFKDEFIDSAVYGKSIFEICDLPLNKMLQGTNTDIKYKDNYFSVNASLPCDDATNGICILYFKNITKQVYLEIEKKLSHPVAMIIMVDNYNDMFEGSLESERAHITVKIDKLLEDFIGKTTGVMQKYNRDRTFAIIEQRHIDELIQNKVKILDRVRQISVNDHIFVTLSIGIGTTAHNMVESEKFARQALEMAQARGGDQAAVKTATGFEFYGGVSKGVERQTKIKARIIANSLIKLVEASDSVYIMGHKISDLDSIGSAVGLACAIRNLGKNAYVVVDRTASLGVELIDKIKTSETGETIFILPSKANELFNRNSLLIIVDTHNSNLLEDLSLYQKAEKLVVIDHHRKMVNHIDNAAIFHHEAYSSSAAEMVTELIQYFGTAGRITPLQAEALLAGIMLDTKNFTIKTGVKTFEAAAFLRKLGADTLNVKILFTNSFDNYKQKASLVSSATIYKNCAIASGEEFGNIRLVAPQAADEMLSITGIDASFVIYKSTQDEVYISARSFGKINVQLIMESLNGGGHHTMAGTQIKNISIEEAENLLISSIDNYYATLNLERVN